MRLRRQPRTHPRQPPPQQGAPACTAGTHSPGTRYARTEARARGGRGAPALRHTRSPPVRDAHTQVRTPGGRRPRVRLSEGARPHCRRTLPYETPARGPRTKRARLLPLALLLGRRVQLLQRLPRAERRDVRHRGHDAAQRGPRVAQQVAQRVAAQQQQVAHDGQLAQVRAHEALDALAQRPAATRGTSAFEGAFAL